MEQLAAQKQDDGETEKKVNQRGTWKEVNKKLKPARNHMLNTWPEEEWKHGNSEQSL